MDELVGGNSAPADSGSASTPTFADAFAPETSPVSESSSPTNDATAAAQPAADGVTPTGTDERSPFIPRARFDEVNTRLNELKQWKEQHGWVEDAQKRAAFDQAVQIGQLYSTDRAGYIRQLLAEAVTDPALAQVVRSEAGRYLAGTRGQGALQPSPPPAIDLKPIPVQLEDGRTIPLYSQEQIDAVLEQRMAKFREELQPTVQTAKQLQDERRAVAEKAEADEWATGFLANLQKLPDFKALEPEVKQRLSQVQLRSGHSAELEAAAYRIYLELTNQRQASTIAKAKSDQLDDLRRHAAASSAPNPGSAAPTTPRSPRSFHDPSLQW